MMMLVYVRVTSVDLLNDVALWARGAVSDELLCSGHVGSGDVASAGDDQGRSVSYGDGRPLVRVSLDDGCFGHVHVSPRNWNGAYT
jgi:hypothetical protein